MANQETSAVKRFEFLRRGEKVEGNRVLGTVAIDQRGMMSILSIANDPEELLPLIVREQNQRPNMNVSVPPPPDVPRFAMATRVVERGSDEFVSALAQYLHDYYDMELKEI